MIYKVSGWHVDQGTPATPTVKYFNDANNDASYNARNQAERQYHLFCAAAATSAYETDCAEIATIEGVQIERKVFHHPVIETEPEEGGEPTED